MHPGGDLWCCVKHHLAGKTIIVICDNPVWLLCSHLEISEGSLCGSALAVGTDLTQPVPPPQTKYIKINK